jgi:hypothetical protein
MREARSEWKSLETDKMGFRRMLYDIRLSLVTCWDLHVLQ